MGLLVALFIPTFMHAAAEPMHAKPTLWIAHDAEPEVIADWHFPFHYFNNYVTGLCRQDLERVFITNIKILLCSLSSWRQEEWQ